MRRIVVLLPLLLAACGAPSESAVPAQSQLPYEKLIDLGWGATVVRFEDPQTGATCYVYDAGADAGSIDCISPEVAP